MPNHQRSAEEAAYARGNTVTLLCTLLLLAILVAVAASAAFVPLAEAHRLAATATAEARR